jgi:hypothetical protein
MATETLIPLYELDRVSSNPYLWLDLSMMGKRGAISISKMRERSGSEIRALEVDTAQRLIDNGTITLRPETDSAAWSFVGSYEAFMERYGLRPKAR